MTAEQTILMGDVPTVRVSTQSLRAIGEAAPTTVVGAYVLGQAFTSRQKPEDDQGNNEGAHRVRLSPCSSIV
jgi:hypothetical protein